VVTFADKTYTAGRRWAHASIDVTIVAGSVQLSKDGKVIRVHPIRHDRAKELGAFANPKGRPRRKNSAIEMSSSYRNSDVARVPELDTMAAKAPLAQPEPGRQLLKVAAGGQATAANASACDCVCRTSRRRPVDQQAAPGQDGRRPRYRSGVLPMTRYVTEVP
jgi:hypothetical protein